MAGNWADATTMTVKATREGLTGQPTASGWHIHDAVPFVALPCASGVYAVALKESLDIPTVRAFLDQIPTEAGAGAGAGAPEAQASTYLRK